MTGIKYLRGFYLYFNIIIFHISLDDDRMKEIGPNLVCAEWLMKNGAKLRWKGCKEYVSLIMIVCQIPHQLTRISLK